MGARTNNPKATLLGDTLMDATGRWLDGKFQWENIRKHMKVPKWNYTIERIMVHQF